jgi:ubiquinone/menaquinone biosynthesis C-methylase UbiE
MSSIKLGDRLLIVGTTDVPLIIALAAKAGLTGRTCLLDERDALKTQGVVEREGVLVEPFDAPFSALPFEGEAFDVAVIRSVMRGMDAGRQSELAKEAYRVLRPGGRCIVIEEGRRGGLAGLLGGGGSVGAGASVEPILATTGFRGVRTLAERERLLFVEGVKPGNPLPPSP